MNDNNFQGKKSVHPECCVAFKLIGYSVTYQGQFNNSAAEYEFVEHMKFLSPSSVKLQDQSKDPSTSVENQADGSSPKQLQKEAGIWWQVQADT